MYLRSRQHLLRVYRCARVMEHPLSPSVPDRIVGILSAVVFLKRKELVADIQADFMRVTACRGEDIVGGG
jgi:hypothetical protein